MHALRVGVLKKSNERALKNIKVFNNETFVGQPSCSKQLYQTASNVTPCLTLQGAPHIKAP
jgi:hypothetical protein